MFDEKGQALETLKAIILEDDRKLSESIEREINVLKDELLEPENFAKKVDVRADKKIDDLKKNFGTYFKSELKASVQNELKNSQDEVINALYPIIGKLIKKYIRSEIEMLTEQIDKQINNTFSFDLWVRRIKAYFSGTDSSSIILSELNKPTIEEVFLIQNGSGLLIGNASKQEIGDKDVVAGMLIAIKAFVEDAFSKQHESLATIQYESFTLMVQNYQTMTIAFAVNGVINAEFKKSIQEQSDDYIGQFTAKTHTTNINSELQESISKSLAQFFLSS